MNLGSGGKKITIRDVATAAEVSPATVSMVLNNSSRISDPVRGRVLEAVKTLKYRPTCVGRPAQGTPRRKLESSHQKVVVLIDAPAISLNESIYAQAQRGVEMVLTEHRFDVIVQNTSAFRLPVESVGVLLLGNQSDAMQRLAGNLPKVRLMGTIDRSYIGDHVTYDNREVGMLAASCCIKKKCRVAGIVRMSGTLFTERCNAFVRTMTAHGIEVQETPEMDHSELFDEPDMMERVLKELFSRPHRPEMLFCPADTITSITYPLLYWLGIRPGHDIEIITCNNEYLRLAGLTPRPHVIDIRAVDVGRIAAMQMISRLSSPESPAVKVRILPELITGPDWDNYIREKYLHYNG